MMLKSYVSRMESSGMGDRIILLAHDELIKFYESFGFRNQGQSEVKFGGGGWNDMVSNSIAVSSISWTVLTRAYPVIPILAALSTLWGTAPTLKPPEILSGLYELRGCVIISYLLLFA